EIGVRLPKGASPPVIEAGAAVVRKHGVEGLARVAKLHFKTRIEVLARAGMSGTQ
ncbi:MAG: ribonuclease HIII, partial [Fimbriimonas ginsengisoli]|nr:ribonuclease HIII [Fimbriimonas ginsengisoli]